MRSTRTNNDELRTNATISTAGCGTVATGAVRELTGNGPKTILPCTVSAYGNARLNEDDSGYSFPLLSPNVSLASPSPTSTAKPSSSASMSGPPRHGSVDRVLVATDDERIRAAVAAFGGEALMSRASHESGTDRVAEAASELDVDLVVNVQGDEPLIDPQGDRRGDHPRRDDAGFGRLLDEPSDRRGGRSKIPTSSRS